MQPIQETKKKNWLLPVILGAAALLLVCAGVIFFIFYRTVIWPQKQVQKNLDQGEIYLANQDEENAILSFKAALDIDAVNERAYEGLANCHESLAERYMEERKPDDAVKEFNEGIGILQSGLSATGSDELQSCLADWESREAEFNEEADRLRAEIEMEELVKSLQPHMETIGEYVFTSNWDAVFEYMQSREYEAFLNAREKLSDKCIFKTKHGEIGYYRVNDMKYGDYMLYFGYYSLDSKQRQGMGDWFGYYDGNNYHARGYWEEDVPQGNWDITEWNTELNKNVQYRYISGKVVDGLLDGIVAWGFDYDNEYGKVERKAVFDHGKWVITSGPDKDGLYASAAGKSSGIYLTAEEAKEICGIAGYVPGK